MTACSAGSDGGAVKALAAVALLAADGVVAAADGVVAAGFVLDFLGFLSRPPLRVVDLAMILGEFGDFCGDASLEVLMCFLFFLECSDDDFGCGRFDRW